MDTSGNVYVTGYSAGSEKDGSGTNSDYATIKYSSNGEQQWVARYDGSENEIDVATAIALDAAGNVSVTGYSAGKGTDYDYATIKYNSLGVEQWIARYNGGENDNDAANSIAVDDVGNVYVTGYSYGDGRQSNYVTVKYSQNEGRELRSSKK